MALGGSSGGNGGDAGFAWGSSGAGSGGEGGRSYYESGGAGAANTSGGQPVAYGDSPAEVMLAGGGAGAGGGGLQGGGGGDTINSPSGGGGGGAGSSTYDQVHALSPGVAVSSAANADGFVVLIQELTELFPPQPPVGAAASLTSGPGSLRVDLRTQGSDAASHRRQVFAVRVACRSGGQDLRLAGIRRDAFGLRAGTTRVIRGLPLGTQCRVDQPDAGGATRTTISARRGMTLIGHSTRVTIVNRFDVGSLTLRVLLPRRSVFGAGHRRRTFRMLVVCRPARSVGPIVSPLPHDGRLTVAAGVDRVLRRVPAGADCAAGTFNRHLAQFGVIDRHVVVRAGRRATLRIVDRLAATPATLSVGRAGTPVSQWVSRLTWPNTLVSATTGITPGSIRVILTAARLSGYIEVGNRQSHTLGVQATSGGRVVVRERVTGGTTRFFWFGRGDAPAWSEARHRRGYTARPPRSRRAHDVHTHAVARELACTSAARFNGIGVLACPL